MSNSEVQRYIRAYFTLTTEAPYKPIYDAMVAKHHRLFSAEIHHWPQFWPWHRYFILKFENLLRRIDCHVTLPYWDFTVNWMAPWDRPMWDSAHLGGSGSKQTDHCVVDGPFARGKWHVTPTAGGGCLKRGFIHGHHGVSPRVLTLGMYVFLHPGQLHMFEKIISIYMHSDVHVMMGGIMATHRSANEPSFWMLHAFADKLWGNWQSRGREFLYTPFNQFNVPLSDQEDNDNFTTYDMVDLEDLPSAGAPGGSRTAVCYAGHMPVKEAYDNAHLHALPVPRTYATEYSPQRSLAQLYLSIIGNRYEALQFKRMKTEPFSKNFKGFWVRKLDVFPFLWTWGDIIRYRFMKLDSNACLPAGWYCKLPALLPSSALSLIEHWCNYLSLIWS